jgi:hypothetical protein
MGAKRTVVARPPSRMIVVHTCIHATHNLVTL